MSVDAILHDCELSGIKYERVQGGDINQAYKLYDNNGRYFLKVNDAHRFPDMFTREAEGLNLLRAHVSLIVPQVIKYNIVNEQQYLLLEWLDNGVPAKNFFGEFGRSLATMHQHTQKAFGLATDNYIGSLPQKNTYSNDWIEFYSGQRILPLVITLLDNGSFEDSDETAAISLCKKLKDIFPQEPPAMLHGDLWSGNYKSATNGKAAIFDPAVYYGHREMDIGMTLLFGGFDQQFYNAYHEGYPLEKDWRKRTELAQLYPILVHAVLFGGQYIGSARSIINKFA